MTILPGQHNTRRHGRENRRQHGAALVEYAIVTFLFALALVGGPNVMHQLMQALSDAYQSFLFALSAP